MAKARCAVQMIYAKRFEESQHPRAPAGRSNGGQFVKANGAGDTDTYHISTLLNRLEDKRQLAQSDPDQLTLAELTAKLHGHLHAAERATTAEVRTREIAAATRVQQVLTDRNFSDDNAPLAVKERIWKSHQRYQVLFYDYRRVEDALANWKRLAPSDTKFVLLFEQSLAAIRAEMQPLANVTGATLPADNPIRDLSFEQKFVRAAEIALQSGELAPEIAAQLAAAIEPANLARTAAMMATLAVAHRYPVAGLAADTVLLGYVGTDGALVAYRLYLEVNSIQSEADLHAAARVLNQELAAQTAGKLIQLLTWGAGKGTAAFNKRYKIALDHAKVKRLSNGSMPLSPNPAHLIPLKIEKRAAAPKSATKSPPSKSTGTKSRPGFNEPWVPPKYWNGPQNHGEWTGPGSRGNTSWIDDRPEVKRIVGTNPKTGKANPIDFYKGDVDFSKWKQGEFSVSGLTGDHNIDQPRMRQQYARDRKWFKKDGITPDEKRVREFLKNADDGYGGTGLRLHHAGGDTVQLIPKELHKVQHTDTTHPFGS